MRDCSTRSTDAGVEVERYHPLHWYTIARINNRTHRKLLVVDGRIGFTGGVGIADQWQGHAQDPEHWRDIHFRVEGPVVAQLQAGFKDNWIKTTGRVLNGDAYFPALQPAGDMGMHLFVSSPAGGSDSMHLMYLLAVAAADALDRPAGGLLRARRPDRRRPARRARTRRALSACWCPASTSTPSWCAWHPSARWGRLLAAGVEIHEYKPTMMHNKMLIVDGELISVGSTNFDMRSFDLNDEASLNIYSGEFGRADDRGDGGRPAHAKPYTLACGSNDRGGRSSASCW